MSERPPGYASWTRERQDEYAARFIDEWAPPGAPMETKIVQKMLKQALDPLEFSEDRLALEFATRHGDFLRYVAVWGKWLEWTGSQWEHDTILKTWRRARAICREAAERALKPPMALGKSQTILGVERLARCDKRLAATGEQWDADIWAANLCGITVNLKNGQQRTALPGDYCSKSTAVQPAPGTPEKFLKFLSEIMAGDPELVGYLKRLFGYCLTGSTAEHVMAFFFGTGANGKSVLISTITGILGKYQATAPIETFTISSGSNHPTDVAGLMGARLVTSVETEEGRRWAEAKIKALTGGDKISARFMRQDFFTFTPRFKLIVAGNHKPSLRAVDEAMRRRLHMVPFGVTIQEYRRDKDLAEKLKAEWPQILTWMIEGCQEWQEVGLTPPKAVLAATEAYFAAQDTIAEWIDDRCETGANWREPRAALFLSWKDWTEKAGAFTGDQAALFDKLETRGFTPVRTNSGRLFRGLRLKQNEAVAQQWRGGE